MRRSILSLAAALAVPAIAHAAPLYNENFDVDVSSGWAYSSSISGDTISQADKGGAGDAYFDYSTVGIPSAPGSGGTTRGLRLQANIVGTAGGGVLSGMNMSPIGLALPSQYVLEFDCWQNFNGPAPAGGSGSTHLTKVSVGVPGTNAEFSGNPINGVQFSATGDGGSSIDWRAYTATMPHGAGGALTIADGVFTPLSLNNTGDAAFYTALGGATPPAAQTTLFPSQTGAAAVGAPAFAWRHWVVTKTDTSISWSVDGKTVATLPLSFLPATMGNNIGFGQADINATASLDANSLAMQFGLIDNIVVTPEPASLSLLAGMGLFLRRRR